MKNCSFAGDSVAEVVVCVIAATVATAAGVALNVADKKIVMDETVRIAQVIIASAMIAYFGSTSLYRERFHFEYAANVGGIV